MALVKVWNDNQYPHVEKFKGKEIAIQPGECVEMEWEEAIEFKGQFTPVVVRGDGTHDPRSFKMIRVDRPDVLPFQDEGNVCHANGKRAASHEELAAMVAQFAHLQVKDPDAEKAASQANRGEIAALRAEIEALKAALVGDKRGPGRPKKEAVG